MTAATVYYPVRKRKKMNIEQEYLQALKVTKAKLQARAKARDLIWADFGQKELDHHERKYDVYSMSRIVTSAHIAFIEWIEEYTLEVTYWNN